MLAAALAERLAKTAGEAADQADRGADEAEAIAALAEQAAESAQVVVMRARAAWVTRDTTPETFAHATVSGAV